VPGGSIIAMVPVLAAARVPIEGIGILLAVDTIPDMFRTTENVTGSLTIAAALRRQGTADKEAAKTEGTETTGTKTTEATGTKTTEATGSHRETEKQRT
jgi:Na+/H+-dicarboxylate symporter